MSTTDRATSLVPRLTAVLFAAILIGARSGLSTDVSGAPDQPGDHFPPDEARAGTVWVVNRDLGQLTIFDAGSGDAWDPIPVGAGAHDICISEHAGKAYIMAETINSVTTVDTRTLEVDAIPVGPMPHHCEPSADGRLIYVSLASHPATPTPGVAQVAIIDTDDNSVEYVMSSTNPLARSHGPHPSLHGDTLYVAHDTGNEVTAIDTETGTIDSIATITRAEEVVPTRVGHLLWASSRGDGTVKRIDLDTKTITGAVAVGMQPESVLLTPSERTLVASLRGTPATLAFVDTVAMTLSGTVPIGGAGTFGDLAVVTPDGRFVYATFDATASQTGGVAVVDVQRQALVDVWAYPGTGRPHGIWYSRKKPHEHTDER
jgi:hypothetical protein